MKISKKDLVQHIKEGKDISEIINNHLNVIGKNDDVESREEVKNHTTTDSFVDASAQQIGKNRFLSTYLEEDELLETNSELQGKKYHVPENVIQDLRNKSGGEGNDRIQGILNNPTMNYDQVKRFKHDIENTYTGNWQAALSWINSVLGTDRDFSHSTKKSTMDIGMENRFRKTHDKNTSTLGSMKSSFSINESDDFNRYKVSALRDMLKSKKDEVIKLKNEIKQITMILNSKIKNNIDESNKTLNNGKANN